MTYSYTVAKEALTEGDKNRLLAIFLNTAEPNVDWAKATTEFGAASVESMKVSYRNVLKKIEAAGGKAGVDASATPKPKATPKRKKATTADDADNEETPKKKGRKAKAKTPAKIDSADDDEEVKGEVKEGDSV